MNAPLKADVAAAERLLKAALREAQRLIAYHGPIEQWTGHIGAIWRANDFRPDVVEMLAEATRSADLLLKGGE